MAQEYVHLPLDEPIEFMTGSYWVSQEDRIPYNGQEILCVVKQTSIITSCYGGTPGVRSVAVPGFIKRWRYKTNSNGLPVSEVEPINDKDAQKELARLLREKYSTWQVEFL